MIIVRIQGLSEIIMQNRVVQYYSADPRVIQDSHSDYSADPRTVQDYNADQGHARL